MMHYGHEMLGSAECWIHLIFTFTRSQENEYKNCYSFVQRNREQMHTQKLNEFPIDRRNSFIVSSLASCTIYSRSANMVKTESWVYAKNYVLAWYRRNRFRAFSRTFIVFIYVYYFDYFDFREVWVAPIYFRIGRSLEDRGTWLHMHACINYMHQFVWHAKVLWMPRFLF